MENFLENTGIHFYPTSGLSSDDLNKMNDTINALVKQVNYLMGGFINLNIEGEDKHYSFDEMVQAIPESRQKTGIQVRFKDEDGDWTEFTFLGGDWTNQDNWRTSRESDIVDGGQW